MQSGVPDPATAANTATPTAYCPDVANDPDRHAVLPDDPGHHPSASDSAPSSPTASVFPSIHSPTCLQACLHQPVATIAMVKQCFGLRRCVRLRLQERSGVEWSRKDGGRLPRAAPQRRRSTRQSGAAREATQRRGRRGRRRPTRGRGGERERERRRRVGAKNRKVAHAPCL